eukprot:SRR837773.4429.p2 GENE.SRR837773.4429~~SRR837773.4429.p2  ORF type:complete len:649 (+),score=295.50 SRR837773.4429:74-1948(+)
MEDAEAMATPRQRLEAAEASISHGFLDADEEMPPADAGEASGGRGKAKRPSTEVAEAPADTDEKPRRIPTLLPSVFEGRAPVLVFPYTQACGAEQRCLERAVRTGPEHPKMYYAHTDKVHEYNAVINILRHGGLYRLRPDSQRWALLWSSQPTAETLSGLKPCQRTNHFPGSHHLGRKDMVWRNISRMKQRYGAPYEITPDVFILPREMEAFDRARFEDRSRLWIWKPCSASCGRGIKVLSSDIPPEEVGELKRKRGVIQRYVPDPLLIDGYKFDLRIYVIVLSYDPLKVYINEEGLVRIATEKYSSAPESLASRTMHLTNYSVNKLSEKFVQNTDGRGAKVGLEKEAKGGDLEEQDEEGRAFKWSLAELQQYFKKKGLDYGKMMEGINDLAIKTLLAVEGPIRAEWSKAMMQEEEGWAARGSGGCHRHSCFELYGFDVLVDSAMKPWLLEVNICPSLSSGSPLDKRIKTKLVADTLTLVGLRPAAAMCADRELARRAASAGVLDPDSKEYGTTINSMSSATLQERSARLRACKTPRDTIATFDQADWELIMDCHDEDFRCGGLQRIFPTPSSRAYVPFMEQESYCDLVLRKWQEAGGGSLFAKGENAKLLPPWLPRQTCFSRT